MFRRLAFTAALSLAAFAPAQAQSAMQAPASAESAQCATLHTVLMHHAQSLGLDSIQLDSIHAVVHAAIANGAEPDSVHRALVATLMQSMGAHAGAAGNLQDHMQHMQAMQLDSATIADIHACLNIHARR
jgi:hypothetical protein